MTWYGIDAETFVLDAIRLASLWLAAGLGAGVLFARTRPGRAHALVLAGLLAAVAAPVVSTAARALGLGLLGPPASAADPNAPLPAGPWGPGASLDGGWSAPAIAVAVWGAISLLLLARLALSARRAAHLVRQARPADADLQETARRVAARAGLAAAPVICLSRAVRSPVIWCWGARPRVLLPAEITEGPGHELPDVLCHEFAHLQRRDHVAALAAELALCLLPWHPLCWLAARTRRALSERACDARVLAGGAAAASYARTLLALAARPQPRIGLAAVSTRSGLGRRITWILDSRAVRSEGGRRFGLASAGAATLVVTVSGLAHHAAPVPSAAPAPEVETPPALTDAAGSGIIVAPTELDLGEVAPNEVARGYVWLLNAGGVPRRLTAARPDCGCTVVPGFAPTTLAPGESLRLEITMKAPALAGSAKTRNVVFSIDGQPPLKLPVSLSTTSS